VTPPTLGKIIALFAPEGLLLVLTAWLDRAEMLPELPRYAAAVAYTAAGLLALRLRRTRVAHAVLALALAFPVLAGPAAGGFLVSDATRNAALFLLPLDLAALAFLADRSPFGPAGLMRLGVILGQAALVAAVALRDPAAATAILDREILPTDASDVLPLPQPVLASLLLAVAVQTGAVLFRPDPMRRGFLWATAALTFAALEPVDTGDAATYLVTAGVILGVAVIETSYTLAYRDGLTGLPSRRAFNEELLGLGSRYVIAMVDVDRFKGINDKHGHDVGDQVLRLVASRLARVRGGGRAYRYGGEEFALIFIGKRLDEVVPHLEGIRKAIEEARFTVRGPDRPKRRPKQPKPSRGERPTLKITVSIGAAERTERLAEPEQVIKEADRALYRAKNGGRNRVVA